MALAFSLFSQISLTAGQGRDERSLRHQHVLRGPPLSLALLFPRDFSVSFCLRVFSFLASYWKKNVAQWEERRWSLHDDYYYTSLFLSYPISSVSARRCQKVEGEAKSQRPAPASHGASQLWFSLASGKTRVARWCTRRHCATISRPDSKCTIFCSLVLLCQSHVFMSVFW